jgi:O-antigen ligase/polysaccharide polymerase Wzy-like membrane protein
MAGAAALGAARAWTVRPGRDERVVAWTALAASTAICAIGLLANSQRVVGLGAALVAILGAFLAPQLMLAVFLVAGGLKTAPFLAAVPGDLTLLTAAGVVAAMGIRAVKKDGIPAFPLASILAIGITALVVLSVLWSPAPDLGLDKALRFQTLTMLAFFAPLVLVRSRGDLTRLMILLVGVSLLVALTAVPGAAPNQPLTIAGGESEIELALYASTGVVAAVGYLMLVGRARLRFLWAIPAVMLATTVIDAGSRAVLVGTFVALVVIGVRAVVGARHKIVPIAVMVVGIVVAVSFVSNLSGPAAAKYQGLFTASETQTLGKRNFLIQDGVDLAFAYPMGRGASGYQFETFLAYPHNAFVEIAAEQGIIGLALLLALMFAAFRASLRAREGPFSPESIVAGGLLIVLITDAMVSQTFTQFRELWFAMGLALAVPYIGADPRERAGPAVS